MMQKAEFVILAGVLVNNLTKFSALQTVFLELHYLIARRILRWITWELFPHRVQARCSMQSTGWQWKIGFKKVTYRWKGQKPVCQNESFFMDLAVVQVGIARCGVVGWFGFFFCCCCWEMYFLLTLVTGRVPTNISNTSYKILCHWLLQRSGIQAQHPCCPGPVCVRATWVEYSADTSVGDGKDLASFCMAPVLQRV